MKAFCHPVRVCLVLYFMLCRIAAINATTVIPPGFEEMTDQADLIFVGKVVNSRAEWRAVGANRIIVTLVKFQNEEVLKGNAGPLVTLQFMGGTVGNVTLEVVEVPKFNLSDREVLFVKGNGVRFCPIVGLFHGKFSVRKDEKSGREVLVTHNGRELRNVAEIGTAQASDFETKQGMVFSLAKTQPLSLNDFKSKIRAHIAEVSTGND
jgi:hypothetical protein